MYNFEKFTKTGGSFAPVISLRKQGAIGLSQGALQHFKLTEGDWYVVLYFDKSANVLGIKPTSDKTEEGAIKLVKRTATSPNGKTSISSSVAAKSFFEYYQISTDSTKTFRSSLDESSGLIIVNLNEPLRVSKEEDEGESPPT